MFRYWAQAASVKGILNIGRWLFLKNGYLFWEAFKKFKQMLHFGLRNSQKVFTQLKRKLERKLRRELNINHEKELRRES